MFLSVTWASDLDPTKSWSQTSGDPRDPQSHPVFTTGTSGLLVLLPYLSVELSYLRVLTPHMMWVPLCVL